MKYLGTLGFIFISRLRLRNCQPNSVLELWMVATMEYARVMTTTTLYYMSGLDVDEAWCSFSSDQQYIGVGWM